MITNYSKIFICGMYRSGSTLQMNLIKKIVWAHSIRDRFGNKIPAKKVHLDWSNANIPKRWVFTKRGMTSKDFAIYSRRDIRDVIVSYCQRDKVNINDFIHNGKNYIDFLEWVVENDNLISEEALSNKSIKILNYEKDICGDDNLYKLYKTLAGYFGVFDFFSEEIVERFKFDFVKKHTSSLKKLNESNLYWPNHLADGKVGKYKSFMSEENLNEILSKPILKDWLIKHEYVEG